MKTKLSLIVLSVLPVIFILAGIGLAKGDSKATSSYAPVVITDSFNEIMVK